MERSSELFASVVTTLALSLILIRPALANDEAKQYVIVTNTQHMDLSAGGTVKLSNTKDELTIEGWDQPGVEITTTKSSKYEFGVADREKVAKELENVKIAAELKGNELDIATNGPGDRKFLFLRTARDYKLTYVIKVPRNVKLIVDGSGEAHFDSVTGDIDAKIRKGLITLRLAPGEQYGIDASTRIGSVISDFPGDTKHRFVHLGHNFTSPQAAHKLVLREGFGDILIFKAEQTAVPAPRS